MKEAILKAIRRTVLALAGLLPVLPCPAYPQQPQAQQGPPSAVPEDTLPFPAIDCGLNVRVSGHRIADGCLQSALNVKYNLDGTIQSRDGYGQCNATLLPTGAGIRRMYEFDAADGTKYLVAQSSSSFYKANTDCNFSVIPGLQNLSLTLNTACTQALGKLWCVNQTDGLFWWDGTSTGVVVGAPNGTLIDNYANRILIGNVAGSQSQLYVSGYLDGTNWVTSNRSTSPAILPLSGINDGKAITCLMGAYQSTFILAQERRLFGFYGTDNSNFVMRELSNEVGCIEPQSVQQYDNKLVWMSERGIEQMNGPTIDWRVSDPVYPILTGIVSSKGNSRNATDTSQSDFQAGNLTESGPGAAMSATISPGSVVPSSWGISIPFNPYTFIQNDADTTTVPSGSYDDFSSGNLNKWTQQYGTWGVSTSSGMYPLSGTSPEIKINNPLSTGTWSFVYYSTSQVTGYVFDFFPVCDGQSSFSGCGKYVLLGLGKSGYVVKVASNARDINTLVTLYQDFRNYNDGVFRTFVLSISSGGFLTSWVDGSVVVSAQIPTCFTISSNTISDFYSASPSYRFYIGDVYLPQFYETIFSTAYDTGLSTPTFGMATVGISTSGSSPATFYTETSTAAIGGYSSPVQINNYLQVASPQKEFIRYNMRVLPPLALPLFSGSDFTSYLNAETTGYFISQCRQPTAAITSWGLFQCNTQPNGGSLSFWVSTGATCAGAISPGANWQAQTNNSAILAATSTAIAYRTLFSMTSASNTPTLQDCTINWNEGTSRPRTASGVYNHVYHLFFTTGTSGSVGNDHVLTLDQFGRWSLWDDVPGASAVFYNRQLIIGDANATGLAYILYTGDSDNGNPFNSEFRTKDFDLGNWRARKEFGPLFLEIDPAPDQTSSVPLTVTGFVDLNTTANLGPGNTGEDTGLVVSRFPWPVEFQSQGRYISIDVSNRGTQPWKLYRGALRYRVIREE